MPAQARPRGRGSSSSHAGEDIGDILAEDAAPLDTPPSDSGHRTAQRAIELLLAQDPAYRCLTRQQRKVMLAAYARHGLLLHRDAFDIIRLARPVDLSDADAIFDNIDAITVCEIKATNQARIGPDLKGYFFNITGGEQLTAQSLGDRYRFLFVNTVTGHTQELRLNEVLGRARAMYPAWHIKL